MKISVSCNHTNSLHLQSSIYTQLGNPTHASVGTNHDHIALTVQCDDLSSIPSTWFKWLWSRLNDIQDWESIEPCQLDLIIHDTWTLEDIPLLTEISLSQTSVYPWTPTTHGLSITKSDWDLAHDAQEWVNQLPLLLTSQPVNLYLSFLYHLDYFKWIHSSC